MGHTTVTPNTPAIQSSISSAPNLVGTTGLSKDCAGCGKHITERFMLKALDLFWHEDCLKCGCCDCRLGEVGSTLYTKANLILCKRDYLRLFGTTGYCAACNKVIPAFEMVMRAKNNVYHLECFACQQCNHRFCVGDRFYLCDNKILCEYDYEERLVFANMACNPSSIAHIRRQVSTLQSIEENNPSGTVDGGRFPPAYPNRSSYVTEKSSIAANQNLLQPCHQHVAATIQMTEAPAIPAPSSYVQSIKSSPCPATSSGKTQPLIKHQTENNNPHLHNPASQQQHQHQQRPSNLGLNRDDGSSGYGSPDSETFETPNNQ
ncbi:LIM/homeobox protein Lhx3-like [Anopheles coustani]|uniref:LIM/homeobox protein Lhx3-like n=1 Tax=Anopheles coustani TaxID=139045 RepID=UPI0026595BE9|nr:LIM/homeobox protein Lhx3-like [Anopheles coustani]